MKTYTLKEWLEEGEKRFGPDKLKWAFKCPACGKVSTIQEFKNAGAEPNDAYQKCIGRFTGKGAPIINSKDGCNWAAFGLLGTLNGGAKVITENGDSVNVFDFAETDNLSYGDYNV